MIRRLLFSLLLPLMLSACGADPALDLEGLEVKARGGDPGAAVALVDLLQAEDNELADRVYAIVVDLGVDAIPALLEKVASPDKQQREYVIAALGTLKVTESIEPIGRVLANSDSGRRYVAAWALGEIGTAKAVPFLIGALDDDNAEVRRYATRALIKLNRLAVPALIAYLPQASSRGGAGAIRALGDIGVADALEVLLEQARGENRAEAYLALGKLRNSEAEEALIAGLQDEDWRARMNAAMALGPLGGPDAAAALMTTLEDDELVVREWSARSLEMITGQPMTYRNAKGESGRSDNVYH